MNRPGFIVSLIAGICILAVGAYAFSVFGPSKVTVHNQLDVSICASWPIDNELLVEPEASASKVFRVKTDGSFSVKECESGRDLGGAHYFSPHMRNHHIIRVSREGVTTG
mgnify:CR=1 FL=1